jgi:hypothetical protein
MKTESITNEGLKTEHPEWNESYYFCFYNKEHNIRGMTRVGFKPNKDEGMTFLFLFLPDNSVAGYFQETTSKNYPESVKVSGMHHNYQENGSWIYQFEGNMIFVKNSEDLPKVRKKPKLISKVQKVELEFHFAPIHQTYEYSKHMPPESLELGKKAGDKHWEQIAKVEGSLTLGDKIYQIKDTLGQRDHTYGVRDWTGVGDWLYYVIWFNDNLAINPAAIISDNGKVSTGGFLFKNGENIPLKEIKVIDQSFREDGIFPMGSELEILDDKGKKHTLKATVGPIIPVPFEDKEGNKSILIQSFGDFILDDVSGGYGTFETLRKDVSK